MTIIILKKPDLKQEQETKEVPGAFFLPKEEYI